MVDCYLYSAKNEGDYVDAENYMDIQYDWLMENVKKEASVQTIIINDRCVYYIDVHYEYKNSDRQLIHAACDYGQSGIYAVKLVAIDDEEEYSIDSITDFLTLE